LTGVNAIADNINAALKNNSVVAKGILSSLIGLY
jgi:hypothetical protein